MPLIAELAGDDTFGENARTFVFENEGHTLGNLLKFLVSRYPDVEFCGYTVPHPTENKMHFRIQANTKSKALDILKRGLEDLYNICDHTLETFETAVQNYETVSS